ncbi:MAG: squalene synthase HpnC [Calditrichaeota bacterium]|nr:squalene synthase HpnC [Calditrichota bacterium]
MTNHKDIQQAYAYCKQITLRHYENFPVASILIPTPIRKAIFAVYAFARHADDLADIQKNRDALIEWRNWLRAYPQLPKNHHPIFVALFDTIRTFQLPLTWLDDLLTAFLMDVEGVRFFTFGDMLTYCRYSANPVGRIILHLFGYRDTHLYPYADAICTALQLTNFWQDVQIDIPANRVYIPNSLLTAYGITDEELRSLKCTPQFQRMMADLVEHTRRFYQKGQPLLTHVRGRLRRELQFTLAGGMAILDKIEAQQFNVMARRPVLTKWDWAKLITRQFIG